MDLILAKYYHNIVNLTIMNHKNEGISDILTRPMHLLFVGYNPGRASFTAQHHFAGRNNLFWQLLYEAHITPSLFKPEEDVLLAHLGIGLTNLVAHMTPSSADLTTAELRAGLTSLHTIIDQYQPKVVALLGKKIGQVYCDTKLPIPWGIAATKPYIYVEPNPSSRSTVPYSERLHHFMTLYKLTFEEDYS